MNVDVTKPKYFQFNVNIDGIDYRTLKGRLEFVYEGVSYGFPTKIYKDRVEVEIPALQSVIKKRISESDEISCSLELVGEGFHLEPWTTKITVERSAYVDASNPIVEDTDEHKNDIIAEDTKKENKFLLDEDLQYLKKLKNQLQTNDEIHGFTETKNDQILLEETKKQVVKKPSVKKKIVSKPKVTFDKRKFIKEITKIEEDAVKNSIPISETGKHDNPEQLKLRTKVRKILQEAWDKKQSQQQFIQETDSSSKFDIDNVKEINRTTIKMLMESVGMTSEATHERMINHAINKGAKSDEEIFDTLKQMLYPQQLTEQDTYQQQMEFFAKRTDK